MVNLYAFDCDGCLDTSQGPIPVDFLKELKKRGHVVVIVSPSPFCVQLPFEHYDQDPQRHLNLLKAKLSHPECLHYYYFTDNPGEEALAEPTGYTVIKL